MIIHVLVAVVIMYSDLSGPVSIGLQGMWCTSTFSYITVSWHKFTE